MTNALNKESIPLVLTYQRMECKPLFQLCQSTFLMRFPDSSPQLNSLLQVLVDYHYSRLGRHSNIAPTLVHLLQSGT